jgi:hypothetical protein
MAKSPKSTIVLDWINVTYRSVLFAVGAIVLVVGGGLVWWTYFSGYGPRAEAQYAIARAEERYADAQRLDADDLVNELRASARVALEEARSAFLGRGYDDARVAAIRSENLSQRAIDLARGGQGTRAREVRFYRVEGDVRVKRAGEFAWDAVDRRMTLRVGDQVKTSASASAQLIYFDGTITTIQPGSLLEIKELYEDPATKVRRVSEKLNWGEVVASTQKRNVDGSFHEVATEKVTARTTEAGEFRVAYDENRGTASFDVFQGRIEVASPNRRESIGEGERVRAVADGRLLAKEVLPGIPRLIAPSDQRVFVTDDAELPTTTLSWERVPGSARYHLMISDRVLFTDPLYDSERVETSVLIDGIPDGAYYWKVAAVSPSGVQGPWSDSRRFRVTSQRIRDRRDTTPPPLEITEFVLTGPMLIVNGRTEPGALLWVDNEKVDVYDDGTFYSVVRLRKEGVNEVVFLAQDAAGNETRVTRRTYVESY